MSTSPPEPRSRWTYYMTKEDATTHRYNLYDTNDLGRKLSVSDVMEQFSINHDFCEFFTDLLDASSMSAYFFEMVPFMSSRVDMDSTPFEFVLSYARPLAKIKASSADFREQIRDRERNQFVVNFPNLRQDAMLVVPCLPSHRTEDAHYGHLRKFVQYAKSNSYRYHQQLYLWELVAQCVFGMQDKYEKTPIPIWVSTSGLGVSWLHVRIDIMPKYVNYAPYRHAFSDFIEQNYKKRDHDSLDSDHGNNMDHDRNDSRQRDYSDSRQRDHNRNSNRNYKKQR